MVHVAGETILIEDLGSANGTRVAGEPVLKGERRAVALGQFVEVGAATLIVQGGEMGKDPVVRRVADPMVPLRRLIDLVAPGTLAVLILGETGVGKEVVASMVHQRSLRAASPFVRVNCAAFSEALLESELFGHERGAFTGAAQAKLGLLEAANGGTFLLDEVGELPLTMQAKLLRVLESFEVRPVGGLTTRKIDVRFVAATNRDLRTLVAERGFREDLFYRLNGVTLTVPPLRERLAEIPELAILFATRAAEAARRATPAFTSAALDELTRRAWPGNVRELKNVIERAVLISNGSRIRREHVRLEQGAHSLETTPTPTFTKSFSDPPAAVRDRAASIPPPSGDLRAGLEAYERERIARALAEAAGNQTKAARILGLSRRALLNRLEVYGFPRPRK